MKTKVAIVPTILEHKLFGTPVVYPANYIALNSKNEGSFFGPKASKYSYTPALRRRVDELFQAATRSTNRYFVLHGLDCLAAQSTLSGALRYLKATDVLVACEF
jgi:hypothetical protein